MPTRDERTNALSTSGVVYNLVIERSSRVGTAVSREGSRPHFGRIEVCPELNRGGLASQLRCLGSAIIARMWCNKVRQSAIEQARYRIDTGTNRIHEIFNFTFEME
jgi:hypothetical protein